MNTTDQQIAEALRELAKEYEKWAEALEDPGYDDGRDTSL
jgi:hypothetical protein